MPTPKVYRRPDSRWWWISRTAVEPDGTSRRLLFSGKALGLSVEAHTRDEAQRAVDSRYRIAPAPTGIPGTIGWLRDEALASGARRGTTAPTFKELRNALNHLAAAFGETTALDSLDRRTPRAMQNRIVTGGGSPSTANKVCRHIRAAFNWLIDDGLATSNPFTRFHPLPSASHGPSHLDIASLRRFLDVVDSCPSEPLRRMVRLSLYTGLRRCELLDLPRDAIDLAQRRILVANIKRRDRRRRWLPVIDEVAAHLAWFVERTGCDFPLRICCADHYSRQVKALLRAAGVPESLHLHSLRHTFVTHALAQGIPAWRIKDALDHSSITVTEGYAHTMPEAVNIRYGFEET